VGIVSSILLLLMFASGCSMKFYKKSPTDVRKCCERVSLHTQEMDKFGRYCKVALFLANSENIKAVGAGVRKGAQEAVRVCKFVFNVETDKELISISDEQHYYKVRSYVVDNPVEKGWRLKLDCDPAEIHCEEF
jgi:hypothetical protein